MKKCKWNVYIEIKGRKNLTKNHKINVKSHVVVIQSNTTEHKFYLQCKYEHWACIMQILLFMKSHVSKCYWLTSVWYRPQIIFVKKIWWTMFFNEFHSNKIQLKWRAFARAYLCFGLFALKFMLIHLTTLQQSTLHTAVKFN